MVSNPQKLVKTNSKNQSPLFSGIENIEKDDDDPLSIRASSITILGVFLALMTVLLPIFGIFLDRPFLQDYGVTNQQIPKTDGY